MTDNEVARNHGFIYDRECFCTNPGSIYLKGKVKLTIHSKQPTFLLTRPGNHKTSGRQEDLERVLNQFGI